MEVSIYGVRNQEVHFLISLIGQYYTYEVFRGSVYMIPFASSISEASFFLEPTAARMAASSSSLRSTSVFLASKDRLSAISVKARRKVGW